MSAKFRVGIIGVSGFTGLELVKILLNHPKFILTYIAASSQGEINSIFPMLSGIFNLQVEVASASEARRRCDIVFLALPHTKGMEFVKELGSGVKIVDLSADYRLSKENYEKNYCKHLDDIGLKRAIYGLCELNREKIKNADLIANPGCYPTCSLLACVPFAPYLDGSCGIFIDAKSGVSGAGKSLKPSNHFISANENFCAYSPITHRHACEISEHLAHFGSVNLDVTFVPHLLPVTRGMVVSIFGVLKPEFTALEPLEILNNFYKNEKLIRIRNEPVSIKNVVGSAFCDIFAMKNGNKIWINSAIDNLLKGASSQALQNANLAFGLNETLGLPLIGSGI